MDTCRSHATRSRTRLLSIACLLAACLALAAAPARPADAPEVDRLVKQLGSADETDRELAVKKLQQLGDRALPALRKVAGDSSLDPDVRLRALVVVNGVLKDFLTEVRQCPGIQSHVQRVAWSPDGRYVAAVRDNGLVEVWQAANGSLYRRFQGHRARALAVAWTPDSKQLLTGGEDHTVRLWDVTTGRPGRIFNGHTDWVLDVAVSPDGKWALSCSGGFWVGGWKTGTDLTARLWDLNTGKDVRQFRGHTSWIHAGAFSPDGNYVLTAGGDKVARLWDAKTGREVRQFRGHTEDIVSVSFSRDGKQALTASTDKTLRLWQVATGKELQRMQTETGPDGFNSGALYDGGKRAISTSSADRSVRLWDSQKGQEIFASQLQGSYPTWAAVSPDSKQVVTGDSAGLVRLWRLGR